MEEDTSVLTFLSADEQLSSEANSGGAPPPRGDTRLLQQYRGARGVRAGRESEVNKVSYMKNRESSGHESLYSSEASSRKLSDLASETFFMFKQG